MAFDLRLTTAGRTALADGANVGANAVRLTHVAIGDGSGPGGADDDGLSALRSERDRVAAAGSAPVERRIAFRGDFMPAAAYDVTEVGVFGNAPGEASALLAYWSDGGAVIGSAVAGTKLVVAAVLEFVAAAAEVAVTLNPTISLGGDGLPATAARRGIVELATSDEAKAGMDEERAVTPKAVRDAASATAASLLPGGAPADGTKYRFAGKPMGGLELEEDSGDAATTRAIGAVQADIATITGALNPLPGQVQALTGEVGGVRRRVATLEGRTGDATTSRKGIVELATSDEAKAGADEQRAVTSEGDARRGVSPPLASLLDGNVEESARYAFEGLADGGLRLVRSHFLSASPRIAGDVYVPGYAGGSAGLSAAAGLAVPGGGTYLVASWWDRDDLPDRRAHSPVWAVRIEASAAVTVLEYGYGIPPYSVYYRRQPDLNRILSVLSILDEGATLTPRAQSHSVGTTWRGGTVELAVPCNIVAISLDP